MGIPAIYYGSFNTPEKKKRGKYTLARKISRLKGIIRKLQRAIEKEAIRKKQRDEVRKLEQIVAKTRGQLEKMRSDRSRGLF